MFQYDIAARFYEEELSERKKILGEENAHYALRLYHTADMFEYLWQFDKSILLLKQAIDITRKILGEENLQYAYCLDGLASVYYHVAEYKKAVPFYQQSLAIKEQLFGKDYSDNALSLQNLATTYQQMGDYSNALPLFQRASEIAKKALADGLELDFNYAFSLNYLAFLYQAMGQYSEALHLLQNALAITKKSLGEEHPYYAGALNNLAILYDDMHRYDSSLYYYQRVLKIRHKILGANNTNAAVLFAEANNIELKHILHTYTSLSEQEKLNLINQEYLQFSYLPSLLCKTPVMPPSVLQQVYTNGMALKGMVLDDQQQVLTGARKSDDSISLQLYWQWRGNKFFLGQQILLPVDQRVAFLESIQERTNSLEQQLAHRSAAFRNHLQSETITEKDICKKLERGEAAIEFLMFRLYNKKWTDSTVYAASVLLSGDSVARFIPLCGEKQLQGLLALSAKGDAWAVNKLYSGIMPAGIRSDSTGNFLYRLIWKPLEKYLTNVNIIYYAPVGLLHRIAFKALHCDSAHLLIDKYQLTQVFSTRSLALPRQAISKPETVCIWGNIQYNKTDNAQSQAFNKVQISLNSKTSLSGFNSLNKREFRSEPWQPLPGTKQEMDSLKDLFKDEGISIFTLGDTAGSII